MVRTCTELRMPLQLLTVQANCRYFYVLAFPAVIKEAVLSCSWRAFTPSRFQALIRGHVLHFYPTSKAARDKDANKVSQQKESDELFLPLLNPHIMAQSLS